MISSVWKKPHPSLKEHGVSRNLLTNLNSCNKILWCGTKIRAELVTAHLTSSWTATFSSDSQKTEKATYHLKGKKSLGTSVSPLNPLSHIRCPSLPLRKVQSLLQWHSAFNPTPEASVCLEATLSILFISYVAHYKPRFLPQTDPIPPWR